MLKRLLVVCLCVMMLLGVAGCQIQKNTDKSDDKNLDLIKSEIALPDGYTTVFSIEGKNENELYVVLGTEHTEDSSVYILNTIDKSWNLYQDVTELLKDIDYDDYFVSVSKTGKMIICCYKNKDSSLSSQKYYIVDNKEVREIKIELQPLVEESAKEFAEAFGIDVDDVSNQITSVFSENGRFYLADVNGYLYGLDDNLSGNILPYICGQNIGDVRSVTQEGDNLIVLYSGGVATFDISSGKVVDGNMEKELAGVISDNSIDSSFYLTRCEEGRNLYLVCADKIYTVDTENIEQHAELKGQNTNSFVLDLVCCNDNNFFTLNFDSSNNERKLYCFSNKDLDNKTENSDDESKDDKQKNLTGELRIWTLRENNEINYLINAFTSKYPNVNITVEVGLESEDGRTVTDAIKNLNAEMLADNGPDVIFLDQINIEKYVENGLLEDLSEVVEQIETENNVFSNILRSAERDNGIYAVPARFVLFGETGTKEKVEASSDIIAWVNLLDESDEKKIMDPYQVEGIIQNLLYVSYDEWFKDGSIDEIKVDEFISTAQKLCNCVGKKKINLGSEISEPEITVNFYDVGRGTYDLAYDYVTSYGYQCQGMRAVAEGINGDYKIPAGGFEGVYIPTELLGVNSKSKYIDMAKELIKTQFDTSVQATPTARGNSVNIDAFNVEMRELETEVSESEDGVRFEYKEFSDSDIQEVNAFISELDKPIIRDGIMLDIIYEPLSQCIEGKITKDEAVRSVSEKLTLYISEQ